MTTITLRLFPLIDTETGKQKGADFKAYSIDKATVFQHGVIYYDGKFYRFDGETDDTMDYVEAKAPVNITGIAQPITSGFGSDVAGVLAEQEAKGE